MHTNILSCGLNPALQKTLTFPKFEKGAVNRASSIHISSGGKGQQFSKAANTFCPGSTTVAQFVGGQTGNLIVEDLSKKNISQLSVFTTHSTRTCTTIIDLSTQEVTELVEPTDGEISNDQIEQMWNKLESAFRDTQGVALSGTLPPGVVPDFYVKIANSLPVQCKLLLDGYKGVEKLLETKRVDILKINVEEFLDLSKQSIVVDGARQFIDKYNISIIALTAGPSNAFLFCRDSEVYFEYEVPSLGSKIVNPIGAGDTTSAVFLLSILKGDPVQVAFQRALGAACASCLHIEGAKFTLEDANQLSLQVRFHSKTFSVKPAIAITHP